MKSFNKPANPTAADRNRKNAAVRIAIAIFVLPCFGILAASLCAQEEAQPPQGDQGVPASATVTKSVQAVGYEVGGGGTKVDLNGTELMPLAKGEVKVEIKSKAGAADIELNAKGLKPPSSLGAEFLTYVVWVVTPEGRTGNTGELLINKNGEGKLEATTPAQTFSLIVTAEP